jgi:ADP-ribosylation factor protein 1/Arf/Sar family protein
MTKHDFQEIAGLVLVVDSTDRDRIEDAKDFLNAVIDEVTNKPDFSKH